MRYYYDHGGMGWGGWLVMTLSFVVFWGVVIVLIIWAARTIRAERETSASRPTHGAEDLLAERFARGEIDEEEFAHRREVLAQARGPRSGPR